MVAIASPWIANLSERGVVRSCEPFKFYAPTIFLEWLIVTGTVNLVCRWVSYTSDGGRTTVDHTHYWDLYSAARPSRTNGFDYHIMQYGIFSMRWASVSRGSVSGSWDYCTAVPEPQRHTNDFYVFHMDVGLFPAGTGEHSSQQWRLGCVWWSPADSVSTDTGGGLIAYFIDLHLRLLLCPYRVILPLLWKRTCGDSGTMFDGTVVFHMTQASVSKHWREPEPLTLSNGLASF